MLRAIKGGNIVPVERADFIKALRSVRPSVNAAEIRAFEKYAGISPSDKGVSGAENKIPQTPFEKNVPSEKAETDKKPDFSENRGVSAGQNESGAAEKAEVELYHVKITAL